MKAQFVDWGLIDYKQAWDKQQEIFDACVEYKKIKRGNPLQNNFMRTSACVHFGQAWRCKQFTYSG